MTIDDICAILREKPVKIWTHNVETKELTLFRYLHTHSIHASNDRVRDDGIGIVRQDIRYHPGHAVFERWDDLPFEPESLTYLLYIGGVSFYEDIKNARHDTKLGPIGSLYEYLAMQVRHQNPHAERRKTEREKIAQALQVLKGFTGYIPL